MNFFNKRILKFLYILTLQDKYVSSVQLSKLDSIKSLQISDRTIRRWFNILDDSYLEYFPYISFENFGIHLIFLYFKDFDERFVEMLPFKIFAVKALHSRYNSVHVFSLAVPKNLFEGLESFLQKYRNVFYSDYFFLKTGSPKHVYKEFEKVFNKEGSIKNVDVVVDDFFLKDIFKDDFKEVKMAGIIKKTPFFIPLCFELKRERWFSRQVLDSMYGNVKDQMWSFLPYTKREYNKALKYVQGLQNLMNTSEVFEILFKQLRVSYGPITEDKYHPIYFIFKNEDDKFCLEVLKKYSVIFYRYSIQDDRVLYYFLSDMDNFLKVFSELSENKIFFDYILPNRYSSSHLVNRDNFKFKYWEYFNPKTREWEFDFDKLTSKINRKLGQFLTPVFERNVEISGGVSERVSEGVSREMSEGVNEVISRGINEGVSSLLNYVKENPGKRVPYFEEGLKVPAKTIERWITQLRKEGKIEFKGSSKIGGYWVITEKD